MKYLVALLCCLCVVAGAWDGAYSYEDAENLDDKCGIFIPAGEGHKPATALMSEKDMARLLSPGSTFKKVDYDEDGQAFMVQCPKSTFSIYPVSQPLPEDVNSVGGGAPSHRRKDVECTLSIPTVKGRRNSTASISEKDVSRLLRVRSTFLRVDDSQENALQVQCPEEKFSIVWVGWVGF